MGGMRSADGKCANLHQGTVFPRIVRRLRPRDSCFSLLFSAFLRFPQLYFCPFCAVCSVNITTSISAIPIIREITAFFTNPATR